LQDVCSSDCKRIVVFDRRVLTEDKDEVEHYWLRLDAKGSVEPAEHDRKILRLEAHDVPCVVGFAVDKHHGCPLFEITPCAGNVKELLIVLKRVATFRKAKAAEKRAQQEKGIASSGSPPAA
jgi:hypothetical protein